MSHFSTRKGPYGSANGSTINQKAALASAYQELGKELSSGKLKAVGNYTLQRPIGEGTYGKVRLGLHRLTNTRVAIKQVPKAHSASLTREIHHHRRLHHPNVMKLYEVIATEQYIWMVSELCAGGELYDYLVEREYLPEAEARRVFGQLCLAVAYIHGKGIVHRDLKLENVLLDERCNVKLGDFGFTREFEGKKLMDTFCGTTGYAAPEMLAGKRYTGEEVDVWSLGIILYALLCGALPFDDDDESVMKAKILKGEYELPEILSVEAKALITAILQLDPLKRPTIQAILGHPWFSKVIASTPMSTLEEDESGLDYFQAGHVNATDLRDSAATLVDGIDSNTAVDSTVGPDRLPVSNTGPTTASAGASPSSSATRLNGSSPGESVSDPLGCVHLHRASASGTSESSFYSARSDSESSDRRSSTIDITDPTTAESYSKSREHDGDEDGDGTPDAAVQQPNADGATYAGLSGVTRAKLPRNESQSTIRRAGSNGSSDASHGAGLRPTVKSAATSMSLPTHHELPQSSDRDSGDKTPMTLQPASLKKRGSQGSSRGHHRTPSRTKRRSISSGGIADHHPPHMGSRPIDYVAQLTQPQAAMFCTALEQNLLHQLSGLGVDVGQLVHSICTDACDASGALWWILVRKAQEKEPATASSNRAAPPTAFSVPSTPPLSAASSVSAAPAAPAAAATAQSASTVELSPVPPPLPQKDPSRRSHDRGGRYSMSTSESMDASMFEANSGRLHTVISQEEMDASSKPRSATATAASANDLLEEATAMPASVSLNVMPVAARDMPADMLVSTPPSKQRPKHRQMPTTPSSLGSIRTPTQSPDETGSSMGTPKSKRHQPADRARSNSLSMKQFASTVLGTREKSPQPEQVCIAGETLPFERAKSPSIFGKRTTSAGGVKETTSSIAGKLASSSSSTTTTTSTPKKASIDVAAASPDKGRKSVRKRNGDAPATAAIETIQRLKGTADAGGSAGSRSPNRSTGDEMKSTPSASVESFSTTSLTPQNSERDGKQKPGSSFMATVRTWLGANEKPSGGRKQQQQQQQQKGGKKMGKAGTSSLGYDGPASASQLSNRPASVRKRSGPYHVTGAGPISRRPSKASHLGSLSRRSSTGSTKHYSGSDLAGPSSSYQQQPYGARPSTLRRLSADSITPTGTLFGDYVQEHLPTHGRTPSRSSRPSSAHSQHLSGLQGRKGSAGSGSSAFRMQAGSTYSSGSGRRQAHRLNHDGGTVVRRHRAYGSSGGSPSRRSSRHETSKPGSLRSRNSSPGRRPLDGGEGVEELDDFGRTVHPQMHSGISTPRRSLESSSRRPSSLRHETASGRQSPMSAGTGSRASGGGGGHTHHPSMFVAHKTRTPYKPPSANAALHGSHDRSHHYSSSSASGPSHAPGHPPAAGTGTWRYSWGRPPPSWAGSVDPPPAQSSAGSRLAMQHDEQRPKLRDVFANKDAADDDWTDEDDEPAYSGGLGQLDSLSGAWGSDLSSSVMKRNETARGSPYATHVFREYGSGGGGAVGGAAGAGLEATGISSMPSSRTGLPGNVLGHGRYAGVRSLFQSPSLGNDFSPKMLSSTLENVANANDDAMRASIDTVAKSISDSGSTEAVVSSPSIPSPAPAVIGSRIRAGSVAASASAFKNNHIIEEDEEDEE